MYVYFYFVCNSLISFITKYITCRIPGPVIEPILYEKVMKYQVHRCTTSCPRLVSSKGKKSIICRYGFPIQSKPSLNSVLNTIKSRKKGHRPTKLYNLARTFEERYINDYNPQLLILWDGNMDIQYIPESSMCLDNYVTSYITKSEKNSTKQAWQAWQACNTNESLQGALKSFKKREIDVFEVADKLLDYSLYEFSDQIKWLNTTPYDERKRRIKELKEIEKLDDNSTKIYHTNLIGDYYPN